MPSGIFFAFYLEMKGNEWTENRKLFQTKSKNSNKCSLMAKSDKKRHKNMIENTNLLLIFQGLFFILMVSKWGKVVPNGGKWCKPRGKGGEA